MEKWTHSRIPPQAGRTVVVTGTGGLGYEAALALARAGATVILAGRNAGKGAAAVARIRAAVPGADVAFEAADLASLASIADFGDRMRTRGAPVDVLINNAAVMTPPVRLATEDGFELQFGTNHLGHVALTAELLPLLRAAQDPRVVTVSSVAAREGAIAFDDLQAERRYAPMAAYGQSKLANLMFALELQRRSDREGWGLRSLAAHPGISRTDLLHNGAGPRSLAGLARTYLWFLFQPAERGALPTLYAATSPEARGGRYYGPDGPAEVRGYPTEARIPARGLDEAACARLWDASVALTGCRFG